jgi:hypothetical protein
MQDHAQRAKCFHAPLDANHASTKPHSFKSHMPFPPPIGPGKDAVQATNKAGVAVRHAVTTRAGEDVEKEKSDGNQAGCRRGQGRAARPSVALAVAALAVAALAIALAPAACCAETQLVASRVGAARATGRQGCGACDTLRRWPGVAPRWAPAACAGQREPCEHALGPTPLHAHYLFHLSGRGKGAWRALRGGSAGLVDDTGDGEGPRAPRSSRWLNGDTSFEEMLLRPPTQSGGDQDSSDSDADEDNLNIKAALRRNYLTREEQEEFWAEYHNDTYWANLTLRPLARGAEDTEEERQWEEERLHGDLLTYRRTFVPTPKYLAWKARQEQLALEAELARRNAIECARDLSMSDSATSDSEGNWYFVNTDEGLRYPLCRPQHGQGPDNGTRYGQMINYDPSFDPGALDAQGPELSFSYMGQDVQEIVDMHINYTLAAVHTVLREDEMKEEQSKRKVQGQVLNCSSTLYYVLSKKRTASRRAKQTQGASTGTKLFLNFVHIYRYTP